MFVMTMVFLAGLVFFVHQLLLQYSATDLSNIPQNDDYFMMKNIVDIVNESILYSSTCDDALAKIRELDRNIKKIKGMYVIGLKYNKRSYPHLFCNTFINSTGNKTALVLDINIISGNVETDGSFVFYK